MARAIKLIFAFFVNIYAIVLKILTYSCNSKSLLEFMNI